MDETPENLRRLIASYRERLSAGGGLETVTFCLRGIEDAERRLVEIERQARLIQRPGEGHRNTRD